MIKSFEVASESELKPKEAKPYIGPKNEAHKWTTGMGILLETGYRINFNTIKRCFRSLCMVHNETVNVWSHLLGSVAFIAVIFFIASNPCKDIEQEIDVPQWPLVLHMLGAVTQMSASAYYHLFNCHSEKISDVWQRLDYAGIAVMVACSLTPPYYYGFLCPQKLFWRWLWIGLGWICCSAALLTVMQVTKRNWVNAVAWVAAGGSAIPPVVHLAYYPDKYMQPDFLLWPWLSGGIIYALGALIYALKVPERFWTKKFDIVGASHQIFHFCVLFAAGLHGYGSLHMFSKAK